MEENNYKEIYNRRFKKIEIMLLDIILISLYLYSILAFCGVFANLSNKNITIFSVVAVFFSLMIFFKSGYRQGLSAALLAYLIATQFGMSTIYYLLGPEYLQSFSNTTLRFLTSTQYEKAILLGVISVITFVYGSRFGYIYNKKIKLKEYSIARIRNEEKVTFIVGCMLLTIVLNYLIAYIAMGKIYIGMPYHAYLKSGIVNSFYSWIVLMYAVGICFIVAVANKIQIRMGFCIFFMSAVIFFLTGNRGEVLYAALASIGILYYRNQKIKFKYNFVAIILIFIIIPFIRSSRNIGIISDLDLISLNFLDSFAEMGHQLRLSVLILEEFVYGTRDFLLGFSYYNPIINMLDNIIPGSLKLIPPTSFNFQEVFSGLGFSQVAESYSNFGVFGVILFHFVIAYILRYAEIKKLKGIDLAYWGSILAILINATRNRFAFVFGQITILFLLTFILKVITQRKIIIHRRNIYDGK